MELECGFDETDFIVLDTGSGFTKVGFCGEDAPRLTIPTVTGFESEGIEGAEEGGAGPTAATGTTRDQEVDRIYNLMTVRKTG